MPIDSTGGLHTSAQATAYFLQSGQHRRSGNAVNPQREVSQGHGLPILYRPGEQQRPVTYGRSTGDIFQRSRFLPERGLARGGNIHRTGGRELRAVEAGDLQASVDLCQLGGPANQGFDLETTAPAYIP